MKYVKLSALAALFSALTAVAQTSPKTVFIGDYLTQQWSSHQLNWVRERRGVWDSCRDLSLGRREVPNGCGCAEAGHRSCDGRC